MSRGGQDWNPPASAAAPRPASRELAKISRRAAREMPDGYGITMLSGETIAAELDDLAEARLRQKTEAFATVFGNDALRRAGERYGWTDDTDRQVTRHEQDRDLRDGYDLYAGGGDGEADPY
jgi:hypothetical protein